MTGGWEAELRTPHTRAGASAPQSPSQPLAAAPASRPDLGHHHACSPGPLCSASIHLRATRPCGAEHILLNPQPLQMCRPPSPQSKLPLTCEAGCTLAYSSLLPKRKARARLPFTSLHAPATLSLFPSGPTPATPCGLAFEAPCQKPISSHFNPLLQPSEWAPTTKLTADQGPHHQQKPGAQRGQVSLSSSMSGQESPTGTTLHSVSMPFTTLPL